MSHLEGWGSFCSTLWIISQSRRLLFGHSWLSCPTKLQCSQGGEVYISSFLLRVSNLTSNIFSRGLPFRRSYFIITHNVISHSFSFGQYFSLITEQNVVCHSFPLSHDFSFLKNTINYKPNDPNLIRPWYKETLKCDCSSKREGSRDELER
jgi:hypothetical protein